MLCLTAVAMSAMAGVSASETANAAPNGCALTYLCGYYYTNYGGDYIRFQNGTPDLTTWNHPGHGNWDNQFSSFYCNGQFDNCWIYNDYNYNHDQTYRRVNKGTGMADLGSVSMGNSISSTRFAVTG